jgi:hypothetical protein
MATVLFVVKATISKDKDCRQLLRAEYDAHFPDSERARFAYEQVFP